MFKRNHLKILQNRLTEPRRFIQVITGPRQTGKTTLARQLVEEMEMPVRYASADGVYPESIHWIQTQWDLARMQRDNLNTPYIVLILDEIQKIPNWSETVKRNWDEDSFTNTNIKVVILGSSALLIQKGLSESLAGRFETIHFSHWEFSEMTTAFGWNLDQFIFFGGYPGAAPLIKDFPRWRTYIIDSLIETCISRDILMMTSVHKPALLRQLFQIGCEYSGRILSYQKMLGQLHDAGNTTTLAHYLNLLSSAGLLTGIQKFTGEVIRRRGSSPKLQVLNTGLMSALANRILMETKHDPRIWGRFVESAAGAHLVNTAKAAGINVSYWRDRNREVDFILHDGAKTTAIEIKSGGFRKHALSGMTEFEARFKPSRKIIVGRDGMPLKDFLRISASDLL